MTTQPMSNHKPYLSLSRTETSLYLEGFVKHTRLMHLPVVFSPEAGVHSISLLLSPHPLQHLGEPLSSSGLLPAFQFTSLSLKLRQPNVPPPQLSVNTLPVFPQRKLFQRFPFPGGKILSCSAPSSCRFFLSNT